MATDKPTDELATLRSEADAMLAAMFGECSMCGEGPGCDKDCDGFDHWKPKHDASPESLELLKALRLADKSKLAKAVKMVIANYSCEDKDDEFTAAINAAHPLKTKRHDLHDLAMKMVGNRQSKAALVDLVNWLLSERKTRPTDAEVREAVEAAERYAMPNIAFQELISTPHLSSKHLRTLIRAVQSPRLTPEQVDFVLHLRSLSEMEWATTDGNPPADVAAIIALARAAFPEAFGNEG